MIHLSKYLDRFFIRFLWPGSEGRGESGWNYFHNSESIKIMTMKPGVLIVQLKMFLLRSSTASDDVM